MVPFSPDMSILSLPMNNACHNDKEESLRVDRPILCICDIQNKLSFKRMFPIMYIIIYKYTFSIPLLKLQQSLGTLCAHRFAEISKRRRIRKIELFTIVISQDPRKYWILHKIVVTTTRQSIQMHQVLKVGYFSSLCT